MRTTRDCLLPSLALLLLTGCAAEGVDGPDPVVAGDGLNVRIESTSPAYRSDETPWLEVTYSNGSAQPIQLLAWTLPSENLWEDLFTVTRDGVAAPYIGRVYRRPEPSADDFVVLEPGESVSGRVDLARLYDLSAAGEYQIQVQQHAGLFTRASSLAVSSNRLDVFSEAHALPVREPDLAPHYYGVQFSACSSWQKDDLYVGMDWGDWYAADAASYMATNPDGRARYRRWFGSYTSSRWSKVRSAFDTLKLRMDTKRVRFHCDCDEDYYAYVYPNSPYNIYICNVYWDASLEDKGGTVIHEMTHFTAVAGTDDVTYGESSCRSLASNNPNAAVRNADNYAYFCEVP